MEEKQEFTEETIKKINDVLNIAYKRNGKLFGGYLRDVVVPRMKDPSCKVYFKDVDIWFADKYQASEFVDDMNKKYDFRHFPRITINDDYPFSRQQYHLYKNDKCVAWFDVVVSEKFPVDDFDVNFLSYYQGQIKSEHKTKPFLQLTEAIHRKEMTITEEYYQKATGPNQPFTNVSLRHTTRIYHRYLENGWSINHDDKVLKLEMIKNNHRLDYFDKLFRTYAQPLHDPCIRIVTGISNTLTNQQPGIVIGAEKNLPNLREQNVTGSTSTSTKPNTDNTFNERAKLIIELAETADELRKAAKKWNEKLLECSTKIGGLDTEFVNKNLVRVDEPSMIEKLLLMKK